MTMTIEHANTKQARDAWNAAFLALASKAGSMPVAHEGDPCCDDCGSGRPYADVVRECWDHLGLDTHLGFSAPDLGMRPHDDTHDALAGLAWVVLVSCDRSTISTKTLMAERDRLLAL